MASPFSAFRKNQKEWMAAVTILSIVAFVFLSGPSMRGFSGGGDAAAVVRTTKFGNLTIAQLRMLRENRQVFNTFLGMVDASLNGLKVQPVAVASIRQVIGTQIEDRSLVEKWLCGKEAAAMGITVDDDTVNNFIKIVTSQALDRKAILNILKNIRQGISEPAFMDIVREELLALRYRQLYHQLPDWWIGGTATPDERWAAFKKQNEKATIEVAVFSPKELSKQVTSPDTSALKQFFEAHKQTLADPYSPEVGFNLPRKVKIDYLEADVEKYRSLVTEAEITERYKQDPKKYDKEYYEKAEKDDKAARTELEKQDAADKAAADKAAADKAAADKAAAEKKAEAEKKAVPAKPDEKKPDALKKPDGSEKASPEKKPDRSAPATTVSPQPKPAEAGPKPATSPEPVKVLPPKSSGTSLSVPRSPFRLVAFADDKPIAKDSQSVPAAPAGIKAGTPAAPPVGKAPEEKKTGEKKSDEKKTDEKSTDAGNKAAETKKADAKSADVKPAAAATIDERPSRPPVKPAEERLRDRIRDDISQERLKENTDKIVALVTEYRKQLLNFEAAKGKGDRPKPVSPDVESLAAKYHMTPGHTGLISENELGDLDLGKSYMLQGMSTVKDVLFGPTTTYKPEVSTSEPTFPRFGTFQFIFWKTEDQAAHIPKWEDPGIQPEVLAAWKLNEARKLAEKRAEELKAEAAANPGKSLKDLPSAKKAGFAYKEPPAFAAQADNRGYWMVGDVVGLDKVGRPFELSSPFMEKVFGLTEGQADVATNLPKTEYYVVRVVNFTGFEDLWTDFIAKAPDWSFNTILTSGARNPQLAGMVQLFATQQQETRQAWLAKLYADAGVSWEKPGAQRPGPDQGPPPSDDE
jgi:hypothetical protein